LIWYNHDLHIKSHKINLEILIFTWGIFLLKKSFVKKNCYDPINFVLNFLFSSPYSNKFAKFQYIQCSSLIDQSYLLNNMYDTKLVGIWTLNLWIQYYKLKVKFHYYGHFHYKCINTLTCEFWGVEKKTNMENKGEK